MYTNIVKIIAKGLCFIAISLPAIVVASPATLNHAGRTLAANCFQCHGTDGYGMEHLAGERASEIVEELMEMQFESARSNIVFLNDL